MWIQRYEFLQHIFFLDRLSRNPPLKSLRPLPRRLFRGRIVVVGVALCVCVLPPVWHSLRSSFGHSRRGLGLVALLVPAGRCDRRSVEPDGATAAGVVRSIDSPFEDPEAGADSDAAGGGASTVDRRLKVSLSGRPVLPSSSIHAACAMPRTSVSPTRTSSVPCSTPALCAALSKNTLRTWSPA